MFSSKSPLLSLTVAILALVGCDKAPTAPQLKGTVGSNYSGDQTGVVVDDGSNSNTGTGDSTGITTDTTTSTDNGNTSTGTMTGTGTTTGTTTGTMTGTTTGTNTGTMTSTTTGTMTGTNTSTTAMNNPITPCSSLDFTKVKKIEDIFCLGSREKVFQNLPEIIRSYFTLMRDTRSAQSASLDKPRVIVVAPDGSFMFGAATDTQGRQDMEIAMYDFDKNNWDFAGVDFSTNPPKVERDLCKTCHGQNLHPIWPSYGNWPGAYSDSNNGLKGDEANILNNLAKGQTDSAILKALKYQGSYAQGHLLSANSGLAETETNEMIGIMAALKAGRTLTAKIKADNKLSKAQIGAILSEALCGKGAQVFGEQKFNALEDAGYKTSDYLFSGKVGKDDNDYIYNNWDTGFTTAAYYFGFTLLKKQMEEDSGLKSQLGSVQNIFNDAGYAVLTGNGLGDFISRTNSSRKDWVSFRDLIGGKLTDPYGKLGPIMFNGSNSGECNVLKNYK